MIKWGMLLISILFKIAFEKYMLSFSDRKTGVKAMVESHLIKQHSWVGIEKIETEISIKKGSKSLSFKRTQVSLFLALTSVVQQVQEENWIKVLLLLIWKSIVFWTRPIIHYNQ